MLSTGPVGCANTFSRAGSIGLSGWFRNAATGAGTLDVHYELYTRRGEPVVRVIYCPQQEGQPVEHDIGLQTTCPYRGGVRWWFMCPLQRRLEGYQANAPRAGRVGEGGQ